MDLRSSECDVVSLYVVCCSVNVFVCLVCCVLDSVCELFGETIRNVFGCNCYFVLSSIESVDDVKYIAYIPSVRAKIMKIYTDTHTHKGDIVKIIWYH